MRLFSLLVLILFSFCGFAQYQFSTFVDDFGNIIQEKTHPDSSLKYIETFEIIKGIKLKIFEGRVDQNKQYQGWWRFFDSQENLLSVGLFKNNLKYGYWKFYHPNGELESHGFFVNDKKEGWWEFYNPEGMLVKKGHYKDNLEQGFWHFYKKGSINKEGFYTFGKPTKTWRFYNTEGELIRVEGFLD